jgi:hypothetical protein
MPYEPAPLDTEYRIVIAGFADLYGHWRWSVYAPDWWCSGTADSAAEALPAAVAALCVRTAGLLDGRAVGPTLDLT